MMKMFEWKRSSVPYGKSREAERGRVEQSQWTGGRRYDNKTTKSLSPPNPTTDII